MDLGVSLNLPTRDADRQKDRFSSVHDQMSVRLRPGEAGFLSFPCICQPGTAASDNYKLSAAINTHPLTKPVPLRPESGGETLDLAQVSPAHQSSLDKLRQLDFSGSKRLALRDEVEISFKVIQSLQSQTESHNGGWTSLWNLAEDGSALLLLDHYGPLLENQVFPKLSKQAVFETLLNATLERYQAAGFPLKTLEATYIAKLLALVVLMANPQEDHYDYLGSQNFNVSAFFKHELAAEIVLPRWCDGLIRAIAYNEQVAANPCPLIGTKLYEPLLRDALPFGFAIISKTTGEDMGSEAEIRDYSDRYLKLLHGGMDFAHAYLPLILGGVIVFDRVVAEGEVLADSLRDMSEVLLERDPEWTEDNDLVFLLTKELVNRSLRLFGFQI